jgi:cytochrome P450
VFRALWRYIPEPILHFVRYLPSREYRRFRSYSDYVRIFAQDMIKESMIRGDGKDMMSVLLRANLSEDPKSKMSEEEIVAQISCVSATRYICLGFMCTPEHSTLLLAGHDTTANTLTWFLWEVSKHPESQDRIRAEIEAVRAQKGEDNLSAADLDSMVYTQAALKVTVIFFVTSRRNV